MIQNNANNTSSEFTSQDIQFMKRAIELAALGRGSVSPNPMVGCVIVHDEKIIGEGWHQKYGEAHAEVNAINSVEDHSLLPESTCYVTLEPCAHHGKTPPCADLLVRKGVKKVIISAVDANPLVGGKGIEKLIEAGIEVQTGCLEAEALSQNIRFFTLIEKRRPYIILKWAQTADGFVARNNFDSKWISSEYSRSMVHQWRAEEDSILVGTNTAHYDNPSLSVRSWIGSNPLRIVIDKQLRLDQELNLYDRTIPTIVYNTVKDSEENNLVFKLIDADNFISTLVTDLGKRKVQSLIVEGGSATLNAFIDAGLWDEARVFTSETVFNEGIIAPKLNGKVASISDIGGDELKVVLNS